MLGLGGKHVCGITPKQSAIPDMCLCAWAAFAKTKRRMTRMRLFRILIGKAYQPG
jgi:hypothetical protein